MNGGHRITPKLISGNLLKARKLLFQVVDLCENEGIEYHLEGGTLLGIVRDNDLLPWDYDVDISIPRHEIVRFLTLNGRLMRCGYKVVKKRFGYSRYCFGCGDYRIFKVKPVVLSIFKELFPRLRTRYVNLDVFIKYSDGIKTYWQAKNKIMCVDAKYYQTHETVTCYGRTFRVPNFYKDYLTQKYGDWSVPVREWDCAVDEKTVCDDEPVTPAG